VSPTTNLFVACQNRDKEEYKKHMKDQEATLYCPFEECCDHDKTEKGNIVFIFVAARKIPVLRLGRCACLHLHKMHLRS